MSCGRVMCAVVGCYVVWWDVVSCGRVLFMW